jgi:4,5-DOPA dioxygenase extradiol
LKNAPSVFISHGAPTFALDPGLLGPKLTQLGEHLPDLAAVAVVSAHWQTEGIRVMQTAAPETLHDFGGFPQALYRLRYPAPGAPLLASETAALLRDAGIEASLDDRRGFDHGVWVPLMYLLPRAQVPVYQISMPFDLDLATDGVAHADIPIKARAAARSAVAMRPAQSAWPASSSSRS